MRQIVNAGNLMHFFLDDQVVQGEYSNGQIALLRLYEGELTADEVEALAADPFGYP